MKISLFFMLFSVSVSLLNASQADDEARRSNWINLELRKYFVQILQIPGREYNAVEFPQDGRDRGYRFIMNWASAAYPPGRNKQEVRTKLKQFKIPPEYPVWSVINESESYISLKIILPKASVEPAEIWLTIGSLDFSFGADGLLKKCYYNETARFAGTDEEKIAAAIIAGEGIRKGDRSQLLTK